EAYISVDPAGQASFSQWDDAGRPVQSVQNYVPGGTASDENITTSTAYGANGQTASLTAVNSATGSQVTQYFYGTTLANSALVDNDLLTAVVYPDSVDSTDRVTIAYNRQGQPITTQDQNGTVHALAYDFLARPVSDAVSALGTNVDGAVRRIQTAYEVRGMVTSLTSFNAPSGGTIVNQVAFTYNNFRQLVGDAQEHSGSVTAGTRAVGYSYANGTANTIRPTGITYPNGNLLEFFYNGVDNSLSRVSELAFPNITSPVAAYAYLGLGSVVNVHYPQPGVTMAFNDGLGGYPGLDIFGRVVNVPWSKSTTGDLAELEYGYDLASNRTYRADAKAESLSEPLDEKYSYDGLDRLTKFNRGILSGGVITSLSLKQTWGLDATG